MSWRYSAACYGEPTEIFFPDRGRRDTVKKAKEICASCPVRIACLDFAMSFPDRDLPGIYGGLTENERAEMRRI